MREREEHKRDHEADAPVVHDDPEVTRRDAKYGYSSKGPKPPVAHGGDHAPDHQTASDRAYGKLSRKEKVLSEFSGLESLLRLDLFTDVYFNGDDLKEGAATSIPVRVKGWNVIGTIELTHGKKIHDSYHLRDQVREVYYKQFPPGERQESKTSVYYGTTAVHCDAIDVAKARAKINMGMGDEDDEYCVGGVGTHVFRNW